MRKKSDKLINSDCGIEEIGEFELISKLVPTGRLQPSSGIVLDVGDDAAALEITPGKLLLATCDSQIQGVHFRMDFSTPHEIGKRAAAVNLSDIASMGGKPRFALVSIAVPREIDADTLVEIYEGLRAMFSRFETAIVGGNTSSTTGPLIIDVTLLGEIFSNRLLTRSGAGPGDILCVSGELGASRAGLTCLQEEICINDALREEGLRAYRTPHPRIEVGEILGECDEVTACMDISDGLAGDVHHLARQSNVAVHIDLKKVPVADVAKAVARFKHQHAQQFAVQGGEDYELLFTVTESGFEDVQGRLSGQNGIAVTPIGNITDGSGVYYIEDNQFTSINMSGFDHFRRPKD